MNRPLARALAAVLVLGLGAALMPGWIAAYHTQRARQHVANLVAWGDLAAAASVLAHASDRRPADPALAADAGRLMLEQATWSGRRAPLDTATRLFQRATDADAADSASMAAVADALDRSGELEPALVWIERALALDPANIAYLQHAASLLDALNRPDEAAAYRSRRAAALGVP